jgi:Tat protein translocase TatB subunit
MGAGEIVILLIVGIVVVGPQKLPGMMKKAGQLITRLRRMSQDLRSNSGIDRIIREEGLEKEIRELREFRLALSRNNILDKLVEAANAPPKPAAPRPTIGSPALGAASAPVIAEKSATPGAPAESIGGTANQPGQNGAPANPALSLIKPAEGAIAQGSLELPSDLPVIPYPSPERAYRSKRTREYPKMGCDHYDVLPDDLDEADEDLIAEGANPEDVKPSEPGTATEGTERKGDANGDSPSLESAVARVARSEPAPLEPSPAESAPAESTAETRESAESSSRGLV